MIIKLLLKIWPALLPIIIYCLWIIAMAIAKKMIAKSLAKKSGKIIDATYQEIKNEQKIDPIIGNFSLQNRQFIIVLYLSFFIAIICFLFFAIRIPYIEGGKYIPAHMEDGKIVPAEIIDTTN
jgi:hypothetical protein